MTSPNPTLAIKAALRQTRVAVDAANNAAIHLNTLILNHRTVLASEAAIVRDAATLLQHVVQNFDRIAAPLLTDEADS